MTEVRCPGCGFDVAAPGPPCGVCMTGARCCPCAHEPDPEPEPATVTRVDRYTLTVDDVNVTATPEQERRLRELSPEQQARFRTIMGGRQ